MVTNSNVFVLPALSQHQWLRDATVIENSWAAVEGVCENVEDILEPEDFEGDPVWFSARVPIQWSKPSLSTLETQEEWEERMNSLRSMAPEDVQPIIIFMDTIGMLYVVDGFHRIALSIERGSESIPALVRFGNKPQYH